MKVLFITNIPAPYRVSFFNELSKYCEVTVLFQKERSVERDPIWFENNNSNYKNVFLKGIHFGSDKMLNIEVIKYLKEDFDRIIICGIASPTEILAIEWCKLHNKAYCIESDGGFAKDGRGLKEKLKKHLIQGASLYFSTGKEHDKYYLFYGADEKRIVRYPFSSINEKDILSEPIRARRKEEIKRELGLSNNKIVLAVGRFIPLKGYDLLIRAADKIKADVYIVGGVPTSEYLKEKPQNVHFVGFKRKDELEDYYKAADVFAHPTRSDVWGLVVNESMSYGIPVVTTEKCIAGLELIEPGKNGFIIHTDSIEELVTSINELLHMDCAEACLETARRYTIEKMAKTHFDIFMTQG